MECEPCTQVKEGMLTLLNVLISLLIISFQHQRQIMLYLTDII